jgi:hypothetical protein
MAIGPEAVGTVVVGMQDPTVGIAKNVVIIAQILPGDERSRHSLIY